MLVGKAILVSAVFRDGQTDAKKRVRLRRGTKELSACSKGTDPNEELDENGRRENE